MEESEGHWETVREHEDYEIWSEYPHQIRKKKNGRIIKESVHKALGYITCCLNNKFCYKHRLVAVQFVPNPDHEEQVDHINHDRSDYHLSNLRWVNASNNAFNRISGRFQQYQYFDELPVPCQPFVFYNGYDFEGYMIDEEKNIFFHNSLKYRKLEKRLRRNKYEYYSLQDIEGKQVEVYLNKLD
jgi:hypothetical protein